MATMSQPTKFCLLASATRESKSVDPVKQVMQFVVQMRHFYRLLNSQAGRNH